MTKLEKIVLLMTYWTVGNAVEDEKMADARWYRLTGGVEKTEDNLMDFLGYVINGIDSTRMDWTAFQGFMETKREETERLATDGSVSDDTAMVA